MYKHPGSYKDPDGYVVVSDKLCYRVLTANYQKQYDHLINSGLYQLLVDKHWLVSHTGANINIENSYKVILPKQIPFISYPYEWSFNQLKDAALLTLSIQLEALKHGMTLKDATAFNIQFIGKLPIFIDTSSFELLDETKPWVAYGQFCRHFLAPLALMAYTDLRLSSLLSTNLDGIPLDLCAKLLPYKSKWNMGVLTHIHLHAKAVKNFESKNKEVKQSASFSLNKLTAIIKHLKQTIKGLKINNQKTVWDDYYAANNNYTETAFVEKYNWIECEIAKRANELNLVWDMGANNGTFSRIAAKQGLNVVAMDIDANAVDANYLNLKQENFNTILPLVIDLANPSTSSGWNTKERDSIYTRQTPDLIMALALIHHIVIGLNVPMQQAISFFAEHTQKYLIIEFVAPDDSQVVKLLLNRQGQFDAYNETNFRNSISQEFTIEAEFAIKQSSRTLFLLKKK